MRSAICARCRQEVRYGTRGLITAWLHREQADHAPAFGRLWTAEDQAYVEAELDRERTRTKDDGTLETYTARRHSLKGDAAKAVDEEEVILEPEQRATPISIEEFPPRSGIRQILNLIERTPGWSITSLTASRGPYISAGGKVLSISDCVLLRAALDGSDRLAVASWRDGAFDFAYTGILKDGTVYPTAANSKALKAWIKDPP